MGVERRAAPRVSESRRVHVLHAGERHPATVLDLSTGGAFVVVPLQLKPGTLIHIVLGPPLTGGEVTVNAMIVRQGSASGESGYGVMFAELTADTKKQLAVYIGSRLGAATGVAAKSARLRAIQRALRERGARERAKEAAATPPPERTVRSFKPKESEALPEWAKSVDLRELYKDALDSVKNGQEPGAPPPGPPKSRGR